MLNVKHQFFIFFQQLSIIQSWTPAICFVILGLEQVCPLNVLNLNYVKSVWDCFYTFLCTTFSASGSAWPESRWEDLPGQHGAPGGHVTWGGYGISQTCQESHYSWQQQCSGTVSLFEFKDSLSNCGSIFLRFTSDMFLNYNAVYHLFVGSKS